MVYTGMQRALLAIVIMSSQISFAAPIAAGNTPPTLPNDRPASNPQAVADHPDTRRIAQGMRNAHLDQAAGSFWEPGSGQRAHAIANANSGMTVYADAVSRPEVRAQMTRQEQRRGLNPNVASGALAMTVGYPYITPSAPDQRTAQNYADNVEVPIMQAQARAGQRPYPRVMDPRGTSTNLNSYSGYQVGVNQYVDQNGYPANEAGQRVRGASHIPVGATNMHNGFYHIPAGVRNPVTGRTSSRDSYFHPASGVVYTQQQYSDWAAGCRKRDGACAMPESPPNTVDAEVEKWFTTKYGDGKVIISNFGRFAKPTDADPNRVIDEPAPLDYLSTATLNGDGSDPKDVTFETIQMDDTTAVKNAPQLDELTADEAKTFLTTIADNLSKAADAIAAKQPADTTSDDTNPDDSTDPNSKKQPTKPATSNEPTEPAPTDPNEPTEPTDPNAPTEPTDPNALTEPTDPNTPTDPNDTNSNKPKSAPKPVAKPPK